MPVNNSNLLFSSNWDIDQIIAQGETVITNVTDILLYTIADATKPNIFTLMFQPSGDTFWYPEGYSTYGSPQFFGYISGTGLHFTSGYFEPAKTGTVRYYVWSDKVNY